MRYTSSLQTIFTRNIILIATFTLGAWSLVWIQDEYASFIAASAELRTEYVEEQKQLLQYEVKNVSDYIQYMVDQTERQLKNSIREDTEIAHSIASNIYLQNRNTASSGEIKKMIKDALRTIRFNEGRGYFFAFNLDGTEELFPPQPELEGADMLPVQGGNGEFVVRDMLSLVESHGQGFYRYTWSKPGSDRTDHPKIAYIKLFKPYDWVIGTGEYLTDVTLDIQNKVLDRIVSLRFGEEGYFFGSTLDGQPLFSNGTITRGGSSVLGLTDPNGVKVIQEQQKTVKEKGSGFVNYSWRKLNSAQPSPKTSYVMGIPDWGWVIGAGVYLDTIENTISQNEASLKNGLRDKLLKSLALLVVLLALILLWTRRISNHITSGISLFSAFFEKAANQSVEISPEELSFPEFRDIAGYANAMLEKRKISEQLRQQTQLFMESIVEQSPIPMAIATSDGILKSLNQASRNLLGIKDEPDFQPGMHLHEITPPWKEYDGEGNELSPENSPLLLALQGIPIHNMEVMVVRKDGSERWHVVYSSPILDDDGNVIAGFVTFPDITDLKIAEIKNKEQKSFIQDAIDAQKDSFFVFNPHTGKPLLWNKAFSQISGYSNDEIATLTAPESYYSPEDIAKAHEYIEKIFNGETGTLELELINKDGRCIPTEYSISIIRDAAGKPDFLISVGRDVSDRKKAEAEKAELENQLLQSNKIEAIGTLAGGIAHDFNNILASILGYTEIAKYKIPEDSGAHKDLEQVLTATQRAKELVKQILAFSRKSTQERTPVSLSLITREVLTLLRATIPTTITITQHIELGEDTILAHPTQIHQVIMNLCTNAAQAMEETGGTLEVTLGGVELSRKDLVNEPKLQPGYYARLTIKDAGTGIDKVNLDRIFDPYFTTKDTGKGTGMGLAVVHGIVKSSDGMITVRSTKGSGTIFTVYFPVIAQTPSLEVDTFDSLTGGNERILVIDDEASVADITQRRLKQLGYQVSMETDSVAALQLFRNNPDAFDLIFTDQTMPVLTGEQLAKELLAIKPGLPIILCTGYSPKITSEWVRELGISALIMKPFDKNELAHTIRQALDKE